MRVSFLNISAVFVMLLFCFVTKPSIAQEHFLNLPRANPEALIKKQYNQKFVYKRWLARARNYDHRNEFPFETLVYAYAFGPDYDPYGTETIERLNVLAYEAKTAESPEVVEKKYEEFTDVLNDHMANFAIVSAAISLARQDENLTDIEFLKWMRSGLVQRLLRSGKGHGVKNAFKIVSMAEESFLITSKNLKLVDTEYFTTGSKFYHIHLAESRELGKPEKIYTDLGLVIMREITKRRIEDPYYSFKPQIPDNY